MSRGHEHEVLIEAQRDEFVEGTRTGRSHFLGRLKEVLEEDEQG